MTSNPMIRNSRAEEVVFDSAPMTVSGSVNKTLLLTGIVVLCALFSWHIFAQGYTDKAYLIMGVSSIAGFILAMIAFFKPTTSPVTAPAYAICEGLLVGAVSYSYNAIYDGIVVNAVALTLLTLLTMLFLYKTKVIQATEKFRKIVVTATAAIAIFYIVGFVAALLGHPMTVFNGGIYGIVLSLVICAVAAFNFILDFDFIEKGEGRLPDYFEWYAGLSLLVTVIWLYFEILRLLAQLNSRK